MSWTQGYHCTVRKAISRGKGQSVIAKAAYNAREPIRDERTDEPKNYGRTHDHVLFSGIFVDPKRNAPEWVQDRARLWNAAAASEKAKNAREGQEMIISLPWQLTQQQREFILKDFVRENITRGTGRIADVNMHSPPKGGDERNYHAHILMTVREIGPDGFGAKLPEIDTRQIEKWKEKWAQRAARELRKAGFEQEADRWAVGHLRKPQQREDALRRGDYEHAAWADEPATKHRGVAATDMDRKAEKGRGEPSDRGNIEREKIAANVERMKLARELAGLQKEIAAIERGTPVTRQPIRAAGKAITQPTARARAIAGRGARDGDPATAGPPAENAAGGIRTIARAGPRPMKAGGIAEPPGEDEDAIPSGQHGHRQRNGSRINVQRIGGRPRPFTRTGSAATMTADRSCHIFTSESRVIVTMTRGRAS